MLSFLNFIRESGDGSAFCVHQPSTNKMERSKACNNSSTTKLHFNRLSSRYCNSSGGALLPFAPATRFTMYSPLAVAVTMFLLMSCMAPMAVGNDAEKDLKLDDASVSVPLGKVIQLPVITEEATSSLSLDTHNPVVADLENESSTSPRELFVYMTTKPTIGPPTAAPSVKPTHQYPPYCDMFCPL